MNNITIVGAGMMGSALAFPARGKRPSRPVDRHASGQGDYRRIEADGQASEIRQAVSRRRRGISISRSSPKRSKGAIYGHLRREQLRRGLVHAGGAPPTFPTRRPCCRLPRASSPTTTAHSSAIPSIGGAASRPRKMNLNAVGGPCTSYELVAHDQTIVTFCGRDMQTLEKRCAG